MCRVESRRTYLIVRLQFNSSGFSEVNYIIAICRSKRVDAEKTNGIQPKMEEKYIVDLKFNFYVSSFD